MGLEFPEIILLLILALILFGPDKLPEYGAKLGRLVARLRQAMAEVAQPLQQTLGTEIPPLRSPGSPNFCPYCGRATEPDFRFCPRCGRSLTPPGGSSASWAS